MHTPRQIALAAARGGAAALAASRGHLNDLNMYPVPDGDTGSNLTRTAVKLADGLEASSAVSLADVAAAAKRGGAGRSQRQQRHHPVADRGGMMPLLPLAPASAARFAAAATSASETALLASRPSASLTAVRVRFEPVSPSGTG